MNWRILYKYVQKDCNEEELHKLGVWLQDDPANEDFFTTFIEEWSEEEKIQFNTDAQAAWNEFRKNGLKSDSEIARKYTELSEKAGDKPILLNSANRYRGIRYWAYSAVAIMLLLITSIFTMQQFKVKNNSPSQTKVSYQEISTIRGQRTNLKFSDGTKVVLNSSSSLRIPKNYGKETRTIYLSGEAFFEVTHDEEHPFIVISNGIFTKDLGTQFNVMAYDSSRVEVAVKEGLVSLGKVEKDELQKEIVEITPNKLGVLRKVGGLTVTDINHIDKYVGWTEGKLVFRSTPLPEVLKRLEQWFDIECNIEGSVSDLSKRTLTATYDNMPMSEVLNVLAISMKVSYSRQGRTIIFRDGEMLKKNK